MFIAAAIIQYSQRWRTPKSPWTDKWITNVVYTYSEILFSFIKEGLQDATTWINLRHYTNKMRQTQKTNIV